MALSVRAMWATLVRRVPQTLTSARRTRVFTAHVPMESTRLCVRAMRATLVRRVPQTLTSVPRRRARMAARVRTL